MGAFIAMIMWGFGLIWLWFALASFTRGKFYFNIGWWAFTFPLGVFTTATTQMGKEFNSPFFDILGTVSLGVLSSQSCVILEKRVLTLGLSSSSLLLLLACGC